MAAKKLVPHATYADLEAVPSHMVAELIGGVLHVLHRPAPPHANAEGGVVDELRGPFQRGRGGPGGWWILPEPEPPGLGRGGRGGEKRGSRIDSEPPLPGRFR